MYDIDESRSLVLGKLNRIMQSKKTNLAISADVIKSGELIDLVHAVGDKICVLKTHIDIISDYSPSLTKKLRELADTYDFMIFEDRKFADIGNTVKHQVNDGIYKISEWADFINAHILPGEGIIDGLREGCKGREIGLLLLGQMSSKGNFLTNEYTKKVIELAQKHSDFVCGFIAQEKLGSTGSLITMTPGVKLAKSGDTLGQNYNTPEHVIGTKGSDIIIVGRGIYQSVNPSDEAEKYRKIGWEIYSKNH